jgi:hypothetical protein
MKVIETIEDIELFAYNLHLILEIPSNVTISVTLKKKVIADTTSFWGSKWIGVTNFTYMTKVGIKVEISERKE